MTQNKVLIIKTGYSEFLEEGDSQKVSLGDVLRATPLLHHYKEDNVTWLTDSYALPLLEENRLIDRLFVLNFSNAMKLQREQFDTIVNLEKNHDICELAQSVEAWRRFGFRLDRETQKVQAYDRAFDVLAVTTTPELKKTNRRTTQELLFELVGAKWNGEEYILGYRPSTTEKYDVALNTRVGAKWPTKIWPSSSWDRLEERLIAEGKTVTRQDQQGPEVLNSITSYIDWLNSSRTVVTSDSLGLHLGLALKKKVIGLFGPTPHHEVHFYGRGRAILPKQKIECLPCFDSVCVRDKHCMEEISAEEVYNEIGDALKR